MLWQSQSKVLIYLEYKFFFCSLNIEFLQCNAFSLLTIQIAVRGKSILVSSFPSDETTDALVKEQFAHNSVLTCKAVLLY